MGVVLYALKDAESKVEGDLPFNKDPSRSFCKRKKKKKSSTLSYETTIAFRKKKYREEKTDNLTNYGLQLLL